MAGTLDVNGVVLTPSSKKSTLQSNYITSFDFIKTELPDVYEKEFNRYGNRSVAGLLRQLGAEIPTDSDLIKWTEEGRLHTKYASCTSAAIATADTAVLTVGDIGIPACVFRVGQTVFLSANATNASAQAIITDVTDLTFTVAFYEGGGQPAGLVSPATITAFVYGSEFKKGSNGMQGSVDAETQVFETSPVIIKDNFEVSGSDIAQVGWVQTEDGGYLWYMKSKSDTIKRYDDYLEMMMIEHRPSEANSGAIAITGTDVGNKGTKGLFYQVREGGNEWSAGVPDAMDEIDEIVTRMDAQGAIEENTLFINRSFSLTLDNMLATQNSYGVGGTSYGLFDNDEQMALDLGFTGFRRGSYDFYKTDWTYLNDASTRGGGLVGGKVNGIMVPAGSKSVRDDVQGKKMTRPFLHVRTRSVNGEDRKYKTWATGGAGGASTSDLDALKVNFLSERAICALGVNNFFIFD